MWPTSVAVSLEQQDLHYTQRPDLGHQKRIKFILQTGIKRKVEIQFDFDAELLQTIIGSVETEYDYSVVQPIAPTTSSHSKLYNLGLQPLAAVTSLKRILVVSEEFQKASVDGREMTILALKERIKRKVPRGENAERNTE